MCILTDKGCWQYEPTVQSINIHHWWWLILIICQINAVADVLLILSGWIRRLWKMSPQIRWQTSSHGVFHPSTWRVKRYRNKISMNDKKLSKNCRKKLCRLDRRWIMNMFVLFMCLFYSWKPINYLLSYTSCAPKRTWCATLKFRTDSTVTAKATEAVAMATQ